MPPTPMAKESHLVHAGRLWRWIGAPLLLACLTAGKASAQTSPAAGVEATTVAASSPAGVAYDAAGNLYIALRDDHLVRKVDSNGLITTVAGTGQQGYAGDGGAAASALLDSPAGIAIDSNGTLYIADSHNHAIRRVSNGLITTVAGTGVAGFSGDGAGAAAAQLDLPTALSVDAAGNLYIADTNNHRIRRIAGGVISTVAGTGEQGFGGDGTSALAALLDSPTGVAVDPANPGRFYISDTHNQRLRLVDANGNISTVAGNGTLGPGGDGSAAASAGLARPRGVAVDPSGTIYLADSANQRIRSIVAGTIATVAGDGEQGFVGDVGPAPAAVLDTPRATAVYPGGALALADTHNQRVRAVVAGSINTVAGIAPPATEGLLLSGPTTGLFGTAIGRLTAVFSNAGRSAGGSLVLTDSGAAIASAPLTGNSASFDLSALSGGLHTLAVTYAGDAQNAPTASGVYLVNIAPATQTVTFPALASPVVYAPGLTATLAATASSGLPVTYTVGGPASVSGSTLTYSGPGTVTVTAIQAGSPSYTAAFATQTVTVLPPLVATSLTPSAAPLGATNLPLSVAGSGFTSTSVIRLNGTALATTFVSTSQLTTVVPQLNTLGPVSVTVYDPATQAVSQTLILTVQAATASATVNAPASVGSGQQPSISLQLQAGYPVPITGVFTLSFTPDGTLGVNDPAIQFSTGGRSYAFTIPANTTIVAPVALQSGTVAGVITVTLQLLAQGVDVTPASARVTSIAVPRQVPSATVSFKQAGAALTVTATGFSNSRDMNQATFQFTAVPGSNLGTSTLSVPVTGIFSTWFTSAASDVYGSGFIYTQTFNLSDGGTIIQGVTVTLQNSVGNSNPAQSP